MTASDGGSRGRTLRRAAACAALGTLALAGCAGDPGQEVFDQREPLASCGEVTADSATGPSDPDVVAEARAARDAGFACLDAAAAGEGAELVVTSTTVEGDPIVEYHRVGPTIDGLEIYTDGTQDTFGEQVWTYRSCPDTVTASEPLGCWESAIVEG